MRMTQPSKVAQFVGFETVEKGNNLAGQSMNYGDSQGVKFVDDKQSRRRRPEAAESGRGSPGRGGGGGGGASVPVFGEWNANPALADGHTMLKPELADGYRFVSSNEFLEDTESGVTRNVDINFKPPRDSPGRRRTKNPKPGKGGGGGGGASVPRNVDIYGMLEQCSYIRGNPELADGYRHVSSNELQEGTENGVPRNVDINFKPPGDSPGRPKQAKGGCFSWLCG